MLWGEKAAAVERFTARHTALGLALTLISSMFWAALFQRAFGRAVERDGAPAALIGGAATAGVAYATDYGLVPRRLTPGYEHRVSGRSLLYIFGALALGLAGGALARRTRAD